MRAELEGDRGRAGGPDRPRKRPDSRCRFRHFAAREGEPREHPHGQVPGGDVQPDPEPDRAADQADPQADAPGAQVLAQAPGLAEGVMEGAADYEAVSARALGG